MTEETIVPVRSKTSAFLAHPATRVVALTCSYVGTAVAGWWLGKKIEAVAAARKGQPVVTHVHTGYVSNERQHPGNPPVAQA